MSERIYIVKHVEDVGPGLLGEYFDEADREAVLTGQKSL
jgi:hypothetical protein